MKFLALAFRHTHTHRICILLMDNTQVWEIYCNPIFSDYMPHILRKKKKRVNYLLPAAENYIKDYPMKEARPEL